MRSPLSDRRQVRRAVRACKSPSPRRRGSRLVDVDQTVILDRHPPPFIGTLYRTPCCTLGNGSTLADLAGRGVGDEDALVGVAVVPVDVAGLRPADLDADALDVLHALGAALLDRPLAALGAGGVAPRPAVGRTGP